jgi:hypothetical protein
MLPNLQQNAFEFILCVIVGILASAPAVMIVRRRRYGVKFPSLDASRVLYRERWASGRSHRSFWTRLSSVSNYLSVAIVDGEVRVWVTFPFGFLGYELDLEHRIPIRSIRGLEQRPYFFNRVPFLDWLIGRALVLDYTDDDGQSHRIELALHRSIEFLKALNATSGHDP